MPPIHIPSDWEDHTLISFEEFCVLLDTPDGTARHWRQKGIGPVWFKIPGTGRIYTTVREIRRFIASAIPQRPSRG